MGLQTDDLSMITLAVLSDKPPNSDQPKLINGIHLRYALSQSKGFPWHGAYVFRRLSDHGANECLETHLRGLTTGAAGPRADVGDVEFASLPNIQYTDDFTPSGIAEIDIAHPSGLTAAFKNGPTRRVRAKVGIRDRAGANNRRTGLLRFTGREPQTLPWLYTEKGVRFTMLPTAAMSPFQHRMRLANLDGRDALWFGHEGRPCRLIVDLPVIAECVHLVLTNPFVPAVIRTFDVNGYPTAGTPKTLASKSHQTVSLGPAKTTRIEIETTGEPVGLISLFYFSIRKQEPKPRTVLLQAWDRKILVDEVPLTGLPGAIVSGEVSGDRITHVRLLCGDTTEPPPSEENREEERERETEGRARSEGEVPREEPRDEGQGRGVRDEGDAGDGDASDSEAGESCAALIDLCWACVADGLGDGWEKISGIPGPIALPVAETTYPCVSHPFSQADARQTARSRVKYDVLSKWTDQKLDDLHDELKLLVAGGPGSTPMEQRTRSYQTANVIDLKEQKSLKDQNLLGLFYLASLDPGMAQILGLYVVDETAVPGVAYDYIVLAEHHTTASADRFNGDSDTALQRLKSGLPSHVDAWICYDRVLQKEPPLAKPAQPDVVVLPDAPQSKQPGVPRGSVGLTWDLKALEGYLEPRAPVRYLLYRADHGVGSPKMVPSDSAYSALNSDRPMLATKPSPSATTMPPPQNWPPMPLNAFDRGLADGWYSYALVGIDLFGRYSPFSLPARWRQWGPPAPSPAPWYYQSPPGTRTLHAFAVEVRDMTPPAAPLAIEATALDPEDDLTYVRDKAYSDWWGGLNPGDPPGARKQWWDPLSEAQQAKVLPLRVRWQWTASQMAAHPDAREFRIYFNPGAAAPSEPDRAVPAKWHQRIWVVDIDDNYTAGTPPAGAEAFRQYEVLLPLLQPPNGAPAFLGVSLEPSLADPIVYANISVSTVSDKSHTDDDTKWDGYPWGGRQGVEGLLAAPAKIFRAWRKVPSAPVSIINDKRVWATRADYQSNSYYTFRWQTEPYTKAHVFVLLDRTLLLSELNEDNIGATSLSPGELTVLDTLWPPSTGETQSPTAGAVQTELEDLRAQKPDKALVASQFAGLSDNALRGLAAFPAHEDEYIQLTSEPVGEADFAGPDSPPDYVPNASWSAHVARFDGRATNRYFLRAALTDSANNEGPMGLPTPPIYLPSVVAPKTPSVTHIESGNLEVMLTWSMVGIAASGTVFIFRTEDKNRLVDVRLMDLAGSVDLAALDQKLLEASFKDTEGLIGGRTYHYRVVFTDADSRPSKPSRAFAATVVDERVPRPPFWTGQSWQLEDETTGAISDWPDDGVIPAGQRPVLNLSWVTDTPDPIFVVTRRVRDTTGWRAPPDLGAVTTSTTNENEFSVADRGVDPSEVYEYRIRVRSGPGVWSQEYSVCPISRPFLAATV